MLCVPDGLHFANPDRFRDLLASNPDAELEIADVRIIVVLFIVADRLDRGVGGMNATHDRHFTAIFQ